MSQGSAGPREGALSIPYQPGLDGLRAVAVIAVLLYHGGSTWMRGGYLGVDVFFVLSGFLITTLLLTEWRRTRHIALLAFWARRARRLLPALIMMLLGVAVYAAVVAPPSQLVSIRNDGFATFAYVTNWRFVFSGQSYFNRFASPSPLRHTWSLAIEEQFYLLWPLVLLVLLRLTANLRVLARLFGAAAIASALLMAVLYQPGSDASRVYFGTDTRMQALFVGAALSAVFLRRAPHHERGQLASWSVPWAPVGTIASVVLLLMLVTVRDTSSWMYRGGYFLVACATAATIAAAIQPRRNLIRMVLSVSLLRWIGRISYGLYLWHWPIYLVVTPDRVGLEGIALFCVRLAFTFGLASASFYLVEMPIRSGRRLGSRRFALAAVVAAAVVLAITFVGIPRLREGEGTALASTGEIPAELLPSRVLILGDSVATSLGLGFRIEGEAQGVEVFNRGKNGCGLTDGGEIRIGGVWMPVRSLGCPHWLARWRRIESFVAPDVVVVMHDVWVLQDLRLGGKELRLGSPASDRFLLRQLDRGVSALLENSRRVVLLTTPYNRRVETPGGPPVSENVPGRADHFNSLLHRTAKKFANRGVALIDVNELVSPFGQYTSSLDGVELRRDGVHFTKPGAQVISRWLLPQLGPPSLGVSNG